MATSLNASGVLFSDSVTQATAYLGGRGQLFTSSGTFTVPSGITSIKVTVLGGGGGGGTASVNGTCGDGGGAGGMAIKFITGLTPGSTVAVTVGAGGSSSVTGGTSSFGGYCSATGGSGGAANRSPNITPSRTAGGTGTSGDINISGSYGDISLDGTSVATSAYGTVVGVTNYFYAQDGGNSPLGARGGLGQKSNGAGGAAGGPGAGGGGAYRNSTSSSGGTGGTGLVLVEW